MKYQITMEIEHLEEGPYLGTSPDLPGLIVQADTPEKVIQLAPQLAHELIASLLREGDPLPKTLREAHAASGHPAESCRPRHSAWDTSRHSP